MRSKERGNNFSSFYPAYWNVKIYVTRTKNKYPLLPKKREKNEKHHCVRITEVHNNCLAFLYTLKGSLTLWSEHIVQFIIFHAVFLLLARDMHHNAQSVLEMDSQHGQMVFKMPDERRMTLLGMWQCQKRRQLPGLLSHSLWLASVWSAKQSPAMQVGPLLETK